MFYNKHLTSHVNSSKGFKRLDLGQVHRNQHPKNFLQPSFKLMVNMKHCDDLFYFSCLSLGCNLWLGLEHVLTLDLTPFQENECLNIFIKLMKMTYLPFIFNNFYYVIPQKFYKLRTFQCINFIISL
jgi:hypothetical protein